MKTVIFFRHGKSDWNAEYQSDQQRPVSKRGKKAARRMGKFLAKSGQSPDSVITSSAVRARTTVELAAEAGKWTCPVRETLALYESSPKTVLREIQAEPDNTSTLLVAGHEPVWSDSVSRLIGGANLRFPTAAMARIDFEVEKWREVSFGRGALIWLVPPKALFKGGFSDS